MTGLDDKMVEKSLIECKNYLATMLPEEEYTPAIFTSPPGIGKTQMIQQLAKEMKWHLVESILSIKEPTDVGGIPHVNDKGQYFQCIPEKIYWEASTDNPNGPPTIMFYDDLATAHPQVQAVFFKVVDEGKVGAYKFRDNVKTVAASNRPEDGAGAHDIPTALANRFSHQRVKVCEKAWLAWATGLGRAHPTVVAYHMKQGSTDLSNFDPNSTEKAFASPRSWEMVSNHLKVYERKNKPVDQRDLAGLVGASMASKFKVFMDFGKGAISVEEIIKDPMSARIPSDKEIDVLFVTMANMTQYLGDHQSACEPFTRYLLREGIREDIAFHLAVTITKIIGSSMTDRARAEAISDDLMGRLIDRYSEHIASVEV
jgi:hypothetical protein